MVDSVYFVSRGCEHSVSDGRAVSERIAYGEYDIPGLAGELRISQGCVCYGTFCGIVKLGKRNRKNCVICKRIDSFYGCRTLLCILEGNQDFIRTGQYFGIGQNKEVGTVVFHDKPHGLGLVFV